MSKEMNIEESIKVLEKIKEMFLHLKNYGWIEDLKRDFDTDKTIQAIEKVLGELKKKNYTENTLRYQIERLYKSRGEYEKARGVRLEHKTEYISKDKIKEKIEELKEKTAKYREYIEQGIETDVEHYENVADLRVIQVLQELLQEGK